MEIIIDSITLNGDFSGLEEQSSGLVIFAHGSGSSRFSQRNRFVAEKLNRAGLATLLFDLLTEEEEKIDNVTRELRFNIEWLADRLEKVTRFIQTLPKAKKIPIGYFGASTGAAAALISATKLSDSISAVVSRGGRPDLAKECLKEVQAPTLLLVGGNDFPVIEMNQEALDLLECEKKLEIIPGATHLFEEPGKLEIVADLAEKWFLKYLPRTVT
jgi:dienelactone hydrolase